MEQGVQWLGRNRVLLGYDTIGCGVQWWWSEALAYAGQQWQLLRCHNLRRPRDSWQMIVQTDLCG